MYRDMIYTSLAKANPAFLSRLSARDRLEDFIDSFSDFAGDAHFQIERQIIEQYTQSEEYRKEKNDQKRVSSTLRHIDENVMGMIPSLIEQALAPGSEMMEELERVEDELEEKMEMYRQLFEDRGLGAREDSGAGIILEEDGFEKLRELDMPENQPRTLEDFMKMQLKAATDACSAEKLSAKETSDTGSHEEIDE